ncbi:MAG: hypothetical protein K0M45_01760 [Candidatus Paracaedibacteraceae bacterium]|nr:hypothetical protein [Candidatus Paracaedibacteraceae bacterium]
MLVNEIRYENSAHITEEIFIRVWESDETALYGAIRFTHAKDEFGEFFRVQFRPIATQFLAFTYPVRIREKYEHLRNSLQITVCNRTKTAKFGPKGNITANPHGLGIGTYLLSKVIEWAQKSYPDYKVAYGSLSSVDGYGEKGKRRNAFYRNRGFHLSFEDADEAEGHFSADQISQLNARWNKDKIQEFTLNEFVDHLGGTCRDIVEKYERENNVLKYNLEESSKDKKAYKNAALIFFIYFLLSIFFPGVTSWLVSFIR